MSSTAPYPLNHACKRSYASLRRSCILPRLSDGPALGEADGLLAPMPDSAVDGTAGGEAGRSRRDGADQAAGGGFTIQTSPGVSSSSATVHVVRCMPVPTGSEWTTCAVVVRWP
jgi:hypothetical protein